MSDKTPDDAKSGGSGDPPNGTPDGAKPGDKPDPIKQIGDMLKVPKVDKKDAVNIAAASQFAYTLVFATLILGYCGHWIGTKLGGPPWNVLLMLIFGGIGFGAEMYRMLRMFSPKKEDKNTSKKDDKNDSKKGS
jgi:F0F1-type ATP synthase assembly protein I